MAPQGLGLRLVGSLLVWVRPVIDSVGRGLGRKLLVLLLEAVVDRLMDYMDGSVLGLFRLD